MYSYHLHFKKEAIEQLLKRQSRCTSITKEIYTHLCMWCSGKIIFLCEEHMQHVQVLTTSVALNSIGLQQKGIRMNKKFWISSKQYIISNWTDDILRVVSFSKFNTFLHSIWFRSDTCEGKRKYKYHILVFVTCYIRFSR